MSEQDTNVEETTEVPEVSPEEKTAREMGWKPKEEYLAEGGDEARWIDHKEFIGRKDLYDAIHKLKRENKKVLEQQELLAKHFEETREATYKQAYEDAKRQMQEAVANNDLPAYAEANEALKNLENKKLSTPTTDPKEHPDFVAFKERNSWYGEDEDLTSMAEGYGAKIEKLHKDWTPQQILAEVEKKIKTVFAHKFANPERQMPSTVTTTKTTTVQKPNKKKITWNDLPEEAKLIASRITKEKNPRGIISMDQYLKDYALKAGLPYEEQ